MFLSEGGQTWPGASSGSNVYKLSDQRGHSTRTPSQLTLVRIQMFLATSKNVIFVNVDKGPSKHSSLLQINNSSLQNVTSKKTRNWKYLTTHRVFRWNLAQIFFCTYFAPFLQLFYTFFLQLFSPIFCVAWDKKVEQLQLASSKFYFAATKN